MKRIDVYFITASALFLTFGVAMGMWMGATQQFQHHPTHAHINLVGWASTALFGLIYKAYPQLAERRLAVAHLVLAIGGALIFLPGVFIAEQNHLPVTIGGMIWFVGVLTFLANVLFNLLGFGSRQTASAASTA